MRLIVQLGYSGFGDRMRVLCSCIHYARLLDTKVLPVWNDEHWEDGFDNYFSLDTGLAWDGDLPYSVYPEEYAGADPFALKITSAQRNHLLKDTVLPDSMPGKDVFILSRYNMKPGSYETGLAGITPDMRLKGMFHGLRKLLPDQYVCIHVRNTDKRDTVWKERLSELKADAGGAGVVITDSLEVKQAALDAGLLCLSSLPEIKPVRGVHHIKDSELQRHGFSRRKVNEGLIMDVVTAGMADEFRPFVTGEATLPGHSTSRFSNMIEAGRKYGWFRKHFGGDR